MVDNNKSGRLAAAFLTYGAILGAPGLICILLEFSFIPGLLDLISGLIGRWLTVGWIVFTVLWMLIAFRRNKLGDRSRMP